MRIIPQPRICGFEQARAPIHDRRRGPHPRQPRLTSGTHPDRMADSPLTLMHVAGGNALSPFRTHALLARLTASMPRVAWP